MQTLKPYFDIGIVIPLREELEEFLKVFPHKTDYMLPEFFRFEVETGVENVSMIVVCQQGMGRRNCQLATDILIRDFRIGLLGCIGIAGAISTDLNLADVCYAETVIDVYENAKVSTTKQGRMKVAFSPISFDTERRIIAAFEYCHTVPELKDAYIAWQKDRADTALALIPNEVPGPKGGELIRTPSTMPGAIACAAVTNNAEYNDALRGLDRKVLAVETEAGALYDRAAIANIPSFEIRGISDYADKNKGEVEALTKGAVRRLAASNAMTFFKMQLDNAFFKAVISSRRDRELRETAPRLADKIGGNRSLAEVLAALSDEIENELRDLSPQYKSQIRGYRLPAPRIRRLDTETSGSISKAKDREIYDVLDGLNRLLIRVPLNFPDRSLAWVIALDLIRRSNDGKQILPIVINGTSFSVRGENLYDSSGFIPPVDAPGEYTYVYIIDGLSFSAKARCAYLIKRANEEVETKFVFVLRTSYDPTDESDFARKCKADTYSLVSTSFFELTHFVQKNFETSGAEAETIAYRMDRTFKRFGLSAHPSYFAGLQKDALIFLLQADRRAELIQLAVDGYLAVVVASEGSDLGLGRRTRLRFLSELAFAMDVEGKVFSHEDMLAFAAIFISRGDLGVDPIRLINSFVMNGILHVNQAVYTFALIFVESYVLALYLLPKEQIAKDYFRSSESDITRLTFDLYCELGASALVISDVIENMAISLDAFALQDGVRHVLLSTSLNPALSQKLSRVTALRARIEKLSDDVTRDSANAAEKQRELDLLQEVRTVASRQQASIPTGLLDESVPKEMRDIRFASQSWHRGAILLGAGSEHLDGDVKQTLAGNLIRLGSLIIHHWTKMFADFDFSDWKVELRRGLSEGSENSAVKIVDEKFLDLVNGFVDLVEFTLVGIPFHGFASQLCEQARSSILSGSISKVEVDGEFDKILQNIWLTDVNPSIGYKKLDDAFSSLPPLVFLRTSIASHFLSRIYYAHGKLGDRLQLLDAATSALKPIAGANLDRGALERELRKYTEQETERAREMD